jgi:hypothetical protein
LPLFSLIHTYVRHRAAGRTDDLSESIADGLVERAGVLEVEHDADGAARQRVGEREPGEVAGLQTGVVRLQPQPRRRLPVRRRATG